MARVMASVSAIKMPPEAVEERTAEITEVSSGSPDVARAFQTVTVRRSAVTLSAAPLPSVTYWVAPVFAVR